MAYEDLRAFIRALDKAGELKRIPFEVDPHLEITEFADRSVKTGGPALLFEKPKGSRVPVLIKLAEMGAIFPKSVSDGPCKEVIRRDDFSLDYFPILHCWPHDGGRFIT